MKPIVLLLPLALLAGALHAQPAPVREGPPSRAERGNRDAAPRSAETMPAPAEDARRAPPRNDPFADGDDAQSIQTALRQSRLLASGASPSRGSYALILVGERRRLLALGDTFVVETAQGPAELRVAAIGRQKLTLTLSDGTTVHVQ